MRFVVYTKKKTLKPATPRVKALHSLFYAMFLRRSFGREQVYGMICIGIAKNMASRRRPQKPRYVYGIRFLKQCSERRRRPSSSASYTLRQMLRVLPQQRPCPWDQEISYAVVSRQCGRGCVGQRCRLDLRYPPKARCELTSGFVSVAGHAFRRNACFLET